MDSDSGNLEISVDSTTQFGKLLCGDDWRLVIFKLDPRALTITAIIMTMPKTIYLPVYIRILVLILLVYVANLCSLKYDSRQALNPL